MTELALVKTLAYDTRYQYEVDTKVALTVQCDKVLFVPWEEFQEEEIAGVVKGPPSKEKPELEVGLYRIHVPNLHS